MLYKVLCDSDVRKQRDEGGADEWRGIDFINKSQPLKSSALSPNSL
jgi:hypothetical protein